jgi:hypothetical protein
VTYRDLTIVVCCVLAALLITWDLFVLFGNNEPDDTISAIALKESLTFWLLPYAFGVIGGHLFMPGTPLPGQTWWRLLLLVVLGLLVGVTGCLLSRSLSTTKTRISLRAFGLLNLGIVAGHFMWPQ